jgi:hypothetical protein
MKTKTRLGTRRFFELQEGDLFLYAGGFDPSSSKWRPEAEYQKTGATQAMTVSGHRMYNFPTDVIVSHVASNPAVMDDVAPPLYRLNYLSYTVGGKKYRHTPAFPIQILPSEDSTIVFRFWSSSKYDIHCAFPQVRLDGTKHYIDSINYQIIYSNKAHHMVHPFESAKVCLALDGLHASKVIMKSYRELDDFPKLPSDWTYFQFVN